MTGTGWTDERVETLKSLHSAGMSMHRMAGVLGGITKNAVIGKLHRLGISTPRKPSEAAVTRAPRAARYYAKKIVRANLAPAPTATAAPPKGDPIEFMALTNVTCRFPVTDAAPWMFCGDPSASLLDGCPYCPWHMKRAQRSCVRFDLSDDALARRQAWARRLNNHYQEPAINLQTLD